jgi:uncharacterized RDD family membrane protein YckC
MSEPLTEQTITMPIFPKGPANAMSSEDRRRYYNPWMRFFARVIDFTIAEWFFSTLLNIIVYVISFFVSANAISNWQDRLFTYLQTSAHTPHAFHALVFLIYTVTLLTIVLYIALWCLIIEPYCLSRWGCTPGKFLFNLKVTQADGQRLSRKEAFSRSWRMWFYGCAIGLPLINIFTNLKAYFRLKHKGATSWDENHFIVAHGKCGWIRKTIISLIFILPLLFVMISLSVVLLAHM